MESLAAVDDSGEWMAAGSGDRFLRWLGDDRPDCLLIASAASRHKMMSVARLTPGESGRLTVVMDKADLSFMLELAQWLRRWVPQRWDSIRLVAAHASATGSGVECAAKDLSEFLDVEVLAPDGDLVVVPGGSLFVTGRTAPGGSAATEPAGSTHTRTGESGGADPDASVRAAAGPAGAWWRFRPGRPPARVGRRFPVPAWEADIGEFVDPGIAGVVVEEIPCGLWLHRPARIGRNDFAFGVPVLADAMMLLVSRPGDPGLRAVEVRRLIEALPDTLYDRLTLVPYGDRPVADAPLGAVATSVTKSGLRLRNGLPQFVPGRGWQVIAIDADGRPTWRPFAREMLWQPHGGGRIVNWIPPVDHLVPVGQGQLALNERWLVEITESGLWIREQNRIDGAGLIREMALDARYCTVVVGGTASESQVKPPWRAIVKLLRKLPDDARIRLRVAVAETSGNWLARAATRACRRHFEGRPVVLLTGDGSIAPWPPVVTAVGMGPPASPTLDLRPAADEQSVPAADDDAPIPPADDAPVPPVDDAPPAADDVAPAPVAAETPSPAGDAASAPAGDDASVPVTSGHAAADSPAPWPWEPRREPTDGDSLLSFLDEIRGIATPDRVVDPDPGDAGRGHRDTPARDPEV